MFRHAPRLLFVPPVRRDITSGARGRLCARTTWSNESLMADPIPKIDSAEALEKKLQEILVEGSLYRNFVYTGTVFHFSKQNHPGTHRRYGKLPLELKMYCDHEKCKGLTWWKVSDPDVYFDLGFITQRYYICKNCGVSRQHYLFIWQENKDNNIFIKVGQYPALSIEPSPEMAEALGPEDSALYKKGLIEFQFGHGIGAVAYFRRYWRTRSTRCSI